MKVLKTKDKQEYIEHQLGHVNVGMDYGLSQWHIPLIDDSLGFKKYLKSPLLDVGTRNGLFLEKLKEDGIEAYGIEITDMADFAKEMGRPVIKGDIQDRTEWPDKYFKSAVMTHCLEHLDRPEDAMAEIKRIVDGAVIVCIPIQGGDEEFFEKEATWHGHHTFFQSVEEAEDFIKSCGFNILETKNEGVWTIWIVAEPQ